MRIARSTSDEKHESTYAALGLVGARKLRLTVRKAIDVERVRERERVGGGARAREKLLQEGGNRRRRSAIEGARAEMRAVRR